MTTSPFSAQCGLAQAERQRQATKPGLAVRGILSQARAWSPAVTARLARTLRPFSHLAEVTKGDPVSYESVVKEAELLGYRDKLRLAQLLIQLARKEEEQSKPDARESSTPSGPSDPELIQYVAERLGKLKPSRKDAVLNSIGAMFQFQGGISQADREKLFAELLKVRCFTLLENNRVTYPGALRRL